MKEYLLINLMAIVGVLHLDVALGTNLFAKKKFWIFHLIIIVITTFVDNYSSGRPIVTFSSVYLTNLRIMYVPIENYLFGFSLLTLNLILFEFINRNHAA